MPIEASVPIIHSLSDDDEYTITNFEHITSNVESGAVSFDLRRTICFGNELEKGNANGEKVAERGCGDGFDSPKWKVSNMESVLRVFAGRGLGPRHVTVTQLTCWDETTIEDHSTTNRWICREGEVCPLKGEWLSKGRPIHT